MVRSTIVLSPREKAIKKINADDGCIIEEYDTCFRIKSFEGRNINQTYVVVKGNLRSANTKKIVRFRSELSDWCMIYANSVIGIRTTRQNITTSWDLVGCSCKDFLYRSYPSPGKGGRLIILGAGASANGCKHMEYIRIHENLV